MLQDTRTRTKLTIVYAIILQAVTALFGILSPEPIRVASLGIFYILFPNYHTGMTLMLIGVLLAIIGLSRRQKHKQFLFFIPQLAFLILTASSSLSYAFRGHYADGVERPWQFIFIDQLPSFIAALLYILSIFDFGKKEENGV